MNPIDVLWQSRTVCAEYVAQLQREKEEKIANASTAEELAEFVGDDDEWIRYLVVKHPLADEKILRVLSDDDEDNDIAEIAKERLEGDDTWKVLL